MSKRILPFLFIFLPMVIWANPLHDPTCPGNLLIGDSNYIKIDAIIIGQNRKLVTVDGQTLGIGEFVRGAKIVAINPDSIILQDDRGEYAVKVANAVIKSSSLK